MNSAVPTPGHAGALVVCEAVSRVHGHGPTRRVAVDRVSCRVDGGDRVVLTGPSGSGKSTLLHLLAGLDSPTDGHVTWPALGRRPDGPRDVGTVFQGPSLIPELTAAENVALPFLFVEGGRAGDPDRAEVVDALARVGLADRSRNVPDELSGGQLQRVALARALVLRPRLILADEPTGQLDRATAARVLTVLLATAEETGAGVVVASHDPWVADHLDTRWAMRDGRLVTAEPPRPAQRTSGVDDAVRSLP